MSKFTKLMIQGFASIVEPVEYILHRPGVNILRGHNGSGKSTVPSALFWCIYGVLIGKDQVAPWDDVKPKNFVGTIVSLNFTKDKNQKYTIIRCNNYKETVHGSMGKNRLILVENGKVREDLRGKKDTQKEIIKLIGYSLEIFKNSVVLGQNITRILDEKGEKQKAIMDEAFNTLYIQKARIKASKDQQAVGAEIDALKNDVEKYKLLIDNNAEASEILKQNYENSLNQKHEDLERARGEYEAIVKKAEGVNELEDRFKTMLLEESILRMRLKKQKYSVENYNNLDNDIFKGELEVSQVTGSIKDLKREVDEWRERLKTGSKCPTCGQPTTGVKKSTIKSKVSKINKHIKAANSKLETLDKHLEIMKAQRDVLKVKYNRYRDTNKELEAIVSSGYDHIGFYPKMKLDLDEQAEAKLMEIKRIQNRKIVENGIKVHKQKVEEFKKKLKPLELKLDHLTKEWEMLDWLIKDPLSNKGLKSFIFSQLLLEVSSRTKYYQTFSGMSIDFSIDLQSATKPLIVNVNKGNKSRPYASLCGGEKQLGNITASFAIHDVVSQTRDINILFLDEIFENLDKHNIQVVSELISALGDKKSIHLITHRSELNMHNPHITEFKLDSNDRTILGL